MIDNQYEGGIAMSLSSDNVYGFHCYDCKFEEFSVNKSRINTVYREHLLEHFWKELDL